MKCRTELCTPALNKNKDSDLGVCGGKEKNNFWVYPIDAGC